MKKRTNTAIISISIIVLSAVLITLLCNYYLTGKKHNLNGDIERYTVTKSDLSFTAIGSGKITSADIKNVLPQGNITEIKVKVGDYIKVGDLLAQYININGQKALFTSDYEGVVTAIPIGGYDITTGKPSASTIAISDVKTLQMDIQVTEKEIFKIKKDQSASVYIDALNLNIDGYVTRVSMSGKTSGDFSVYDVTIAFDKKDNSIYLGMTGSARILIGTKKDVYKVPVDAIIEVDKKRYILKNDWLENMNRPQSDYYSEVKTGMADSDFVEITEGITNDTEILIVPKNNTSYLLF